MEIAHAFQPGRAALFSKRYELGAQHEQIDHCEIGWENKRIRKSTILEFMLISASSSIYWALALIFWELETNQKKNDVRCWHPLCLCLIRCIYCFFFWGGKHSKIIYLSGTLWSRRLQCGLGKISPDVVV